MTAAVEAEGLGKRYGRTWALKGCTLVLPRERVIALVGPNGAGKSTLLNMMVDLVQPTTGRLSVLGQSPTSSLAELLPRVGFVAQERPLYQDFSVDDMLRMGRHLNVRWNGAGIEARLRGLGIRFDRRVRTLSGGQQAQLALGLALAKDPDLLLLDEPLASLDPLARRELLSALMEEVSERGTTVLFSSHDIAGIERVCDYLVLLGTGSVQIADDLSDILRTHRRLVGPPSASRATANVEHVVRASAAARQTAMIARVSGRVIDPAWDVHEVSLEDIVLAYLGASNVSQPESERRLEVM